MKLPRRGLKPGPDRDTKVEQLALANSYRALLHAGAPLPALRDTEFHAGAQNGEDGILLFLATVLGLTNRRVVEIGSSDGIECNSRNLIVNHGWDGLLIDGDAKAIERGRAYYGALPIMRGVRPTMVHSWITRDNICDLIKGHGFEKNIDVLSVDIDGNDLWVLEAVNTDAAVVVVEYNNRIPADVAVSVPYQESFVADDVAALVTSRGFFGASLLAFVTVLDGYRLVGANSINTNAFFVRNGVGDELLPEVPVASCLTSPWAVHQQERWWPEVERMPWVEVLDDRPARARTDKTADTVVR